jgi:hypothetical protein
LNWIGAPANITDAQRGVRTTFLGGFAGQLVSSAVWSISAALSTWHSSRSAIYALVFGGMFIFPGTLLFLRIMGRPGGLPKAHPMNALGMQVAFMVPFSLPVIGAATLFRHNWFYPACMVIVGAHYFPFIFMYGMWQFGILAASLLGAGLAIALYLPSTFILGGWFTASFSSSHS